jgi:hypothetical protein
VALLAVADAAALDVAARPSVNPIDAHLLIRQATECLNDVVYPMRRIDVGGRDAMLTRRGFDSGWERLAEVGYPFEVTDDVAWEAFAALRVTYAPIATQLLYWTMAAPAPWSGPRNGFPDISDRPDAPTAWLVP